MSAAPLPPSTPVIPEHEVPTDTLAAAPASPPARPAPVVAVVGEPELAVPGVVRALLDLGMRVRVLCADETEARAALSTRPATPESESGVLEIVRGTPDAPLDLEKLCSGADGLALLGPVDLSGRVWRPNTHLDDVQRCLAAVDAAKVKRVAYLSTLCANHQSKVRCLREAGEAEKLIQKAHPKSYVFRSGPLAGCRDRLVSPLAKEVRTGKPWMVVWGYGGTLVQPIAPLDAGRCLARAFVEAPQELQPGGYSLAGLEMLTLLELAEHMLARQGRFKLNIHIPLFVLRLAKRATGKNGYFGERVDLLAENFATEHNDAPRLLGPQGRLKDLSSIQNEVLGTA